MISSVSLQLFVTLLLFFLFFNLGHNHAKKLESTKIYRLLIFVTIIMTILEGVHVFFSENLHTQSENIIQTFHTLNPIGVALIISLWFFYFEYIHQHNFALALKHFHKYIIPTFIIFILMMINVLHPFIFTLDEQLQYVNKWGFWLIVGIIYLNTLLAIIISVQKKYT